MATTTLALTSIWAPFRHPLFRAIWIAQITANIGTWMQNVGAAWLMGSLGGTATQVALVQTAASLPVFIFALPGGALADIVDRRRLLLLTQAWMALSALALGVLSYAGLLTPWLLLGLIFTVGIGTALNFPAWQAIQVELVPRSDFPQAVALSTAGGNLGRIIGPAIGGLLVALSGPYLVFVLNALCLGVVFTVLFRWRREEDVAELPAERMLAAIRTGLRYTRNSLMFQRILVRVVVFGLPANVMLVLLPVLARNELQLGASGFGLLMGAFGTGAVLSTFVLPRLRARFDADRMVGTAAVVMAAACVVLGFAHDLPVVALALAVSGLTWLLALSTFTVAAQHTLPNWVRARGLGIFIVTFQGSIALGGAIWGVVGERISLTAAFLAAAVMLVVGQFVARRFHITAMEGLDLRPSGHWPDPEYVVEPGPQDGPVLVSTEYRIDPAQGHDFSEVMRRVGRSRGRVGASGWGLFSDPAQPGRYLETFIVESWTEYLRQHERVTETDREIDRLAQAFLIEGATTKTTLLVSAYAGPATSAP